MPWYDSVTKELVRSPSDDQKSKDVLIYKPSIFAKEELPTWSEVYEECYTHKVYDYNPNDSLHQMVNMYWGFSHRKFLMATVCNQFNKMIFEDQMGAELIQRLSSDLNLDVFGVQFLFGHYNYALDWIRTHPDFTTDPFNSVPEIYTFPMPNGKINPFITSDYKRIDVTKVEGSVIIQPMLQVRNPMYPVMSGKSHVTFMPIPFTTKFDEVMDVMIKQFKEYFDGDIGWKDDSGNVIEGDPGTRDCAGAGYNP